MGQESFIITMSRIGCGVLLLWLLWEHLQRWTVVEQTTPEGAAEAKGRQRHAQSPRDCPACRATHGQCEVLEPRLIEARSTGHSRRGRPKSVVTDGHSCNNPACRYYQITDSQRHALVGYGKHYGADV